MTLRDALIQLRAFARIDGIYMALLWTLSFGSIILFPESMWGTMLAIATPFLAGARLRVFRDYALDGVISLRRAYAYLWYVFFYASLIFAAIQLLYFLFLDHGTFMAMITAACNTVIQMYRAQNMPTQELTEALQAIRQAPASVLPFTFMGQNMLIGAIISLPIAAVMRRTGTPRPNVNK